MSDEASDNGSILVRLLQDRLPGVDLESWWVPLLATLLATFVLALVWGALQAVYRRLDARIRSSQGTKIRALSVRSHEIFSEEEVANMLAGVVSGSGFVARLFVLYVYLHIVFSLYAPTRGLATRLLGYLVSALVGAFWAFVHYLPNLLWLILILLITRFLIRLLRLFFDGVTHGRIALPGIYPEFGKPTFEITRLLVVVVALVMMFPYLPGQESPAFRVIGIFVGVLVSLGSTGAVTNVISGIVLTYTRAFHVGDRVKIADAVGDVIEKTSFATRIRTVKNVEITIPNAMTLANHIINFSAQAGARGVILHTCVTIGYDTPWRKVCDLLLAAARETEGVEAEPEPFVHQLALQDAYVQYELNATTHRVKEMARIYSDLHQHIQDRFHEAGVEIASPHFLALRDGNRMSIPDEYLPKDYEAPVLRVGPLEWRGQGGRGGG